MSFGAASHVLLISKQSQLCLVLTLNLLNISVHRHCECADVGEAASPSYKYGCLLLNNGCLN